MAGANRRTIEWTPALDKKMLKLMADTGSMTNTAATLGMDRGSVRNRLARLKQLDLDSNRKAWSAEEDRHLTELYSGGRSRPDIAKDMGRSLFSVINRINTLVLTRTEKPQPTPVALSKMSRKAMRLDRRLIVSEVRTHIRITGNEKLRAGLIKAVQKWPMDRWSKISNEPVSKIIKKMEAL